MSEETTFTERMTSAMKLEAAKTAKIKATSARWDLNVALLMIAVMIAVIILSSQGVRVEIVGLVSILGLATAWLMGWRRGKQLYQHFYKEELANLEQRLITRGIIPARELERPADSPDTA